MERVTPLDLEGARLPRVRKGYDTDAVDAMLKAAALEIEKLLRANQSLTQQTSADGRELASFRLRESTLADALVLAQKAADETRAAAHKEAEVIIESAKLETRELRAKANEEIVNLERAIEQLHQDKSNFEVRFGRLLQEHLDALTSHTRLEVKSAA